MYIICPMYILNIFVLTDTTILKITYDCLQKCTYLIAFYCWKGGEDAEMHT